ncbi:uncharacterized protein PAC_10725 [Phialocephala subalpina]|uniref:Uncharacterized protein n=1 Tax=Phialocephala subalpina TaxID=576137 RepID=A0A1L7X742_9HELO|nr:uncharacterized protein PAC_10725 [Phialocephala subalpina]
MFFESWALWEKMTFILGLAILAVFAIGYGKLLYSNRLVKKQEVVDEEKRMRIQELRNSGQIVESRRSHDIPFGVRAIQSGIQVDGIWISQGNTPIPSELKLGHLRGSSTDMLDSNDSSKATEMDPESLRPISRQGRPPFRTSDSTTLVLDKLFEAQDTERPTTARTQGSYKPRRSSHLRHGNHGQYDEETLGQLEGNSPTSKRTVRAHRPRSSRHLDAEPDSSAADNERSSTGASSDSETSLSHKLKEKPIASSSGSILSEPDIRNATALSTSNVRSGKAVRPSLPLQSSKAEYLSIPLDSSPFESSDPFATPLASPPLESTPPLMEENAPLDPRSGPPEGYRALPSQPSRSPSPFIAGELHVNKIVRKVNSGFEVLPAGTFGMPPEFKGKGLEMGDDGESGDRRQSRLQKKPRTSMQGRRPSSTIERP